MSDMRGTVTEGQDTVRGQHPLQHPCQVPVATFAISPCVLWPEKYHSEAAVKGDGDGADAQRVYCYRSIDRMSSQTVLQYSSVIPSLAGAGVDSRYTGDNVVPVQHSLAHSRGPGRLSCFVTCY